jgi:hypothetical protein
MPQVLIDIDDEFIDWEGWARKRFASAGIHVENADLAGAQDFATPPDEPPLPPEPEDPWARPTSAAPAATGQSSAPTTTPTGGRPASPPRDAFTYKDDRGNVHTFNKAGAPPCEHGQPAVYVTGYGKNSKPWKQWRCAASSTDAWKNKCEFSQWA